MGATAVGWNGVMLAEAARIAPAGQVGGATAALNFAFAVTMLVAPPAFSGLVGLTGGYAAGFLLCVAALLGGASLRVARRSDVTSIGAVAGWSAVSTAAAAAMTLRDTEIVIPMMWLVLLASASMVLLRVSA